MSNIKDVAKLADVSISTVSHVINGTRFVSEETAKRVKDAIEELSYTPNVVANSLRTKKSRVVGVVVPISNDESSNIFIMQVVLGIDSVLRPKGYSTVLTNSEDCLEQELEGLRSLLGRQIDGFIIAPPFGDHTPVKELLKDKSYVFVDRLPGGLEGENVVMSDSETGCFQAVQEMIGLGHTKIGLLCAPIGRYPNSDERSSGYRRALEEAGLPVEPVYIRECDATVENGYEQMGWLMENTDITAVFAVSNIMGMGAVKYLGDHGLGIPEDISVTIFDDYSWTSVYQPPLTTIRQDGYEMGRKSAQILLRQMEAKRPAMCRKKKWLLPTELMVRRSWKDIRKQE